MTATVILGIVALTLLTFFGVTITVLVSKALSRAFLTLDSVHMRNAQQVDGLLNRLMAIKWEDYISLEAMQEPDEGGFMAPSDGDEGEEGEMVVPASVISRLRERMTTTPEEQELLDEDFPELRSADEDRRGN